MPMLPYSPDLGSFVDDGGDVLSDDTLLLLPDLFTETGYLNDLLLEFGGSYVGGFPGDSASGVWGLDYPFTLARWRALGAARLVSTPSHPRMGLARDRHLTGFPEFEQFYVQGFPRRTQSFKSVASTDFATPAYPPVYSNGR